VSVNYSDNEKLQGSNLMIYVLNQTAW